MKVDGGSPIGSCGSMKTIWMTIMNKYRDKKIDKFMEELDFLLQSIAAKEVKNLNIMSALKEFDNFEQATIFSMMEAARKSIIRSTSLAICFDRVVATTNQMADWIDAYGHPTDADRFKKRLSILLDIEKVSKDLETADCRIYTSKDEDIPEV